MFAFNERVHSEYFEEVLKRGKMIHSPFFSVCFLVSPKKVFSVVASKKVSKKAVIRNRNKRRIRHILKKFESKLSSGAYIVFVKKDLSTISYSDLESNLSKLLF